MIGHAFQPRVQGRKRVRHQILLLVPPPRFSHRSSNVLTCTPGKAFSSTSFNSRAAGSYWCLSRRQHTMDTTASETARCVASRSTLRQPYVSFLFVATASAVKPLRQGANR